jgi:hypothetical protein
VKNRGYRRFDLLLTLAFSICLASVSAAQNGGDTTQTAAPATPNSTAPANKDVPPASAQQDSPSEQTPNSPSADSQYERAEQELKQQTQQRILGVIPNFNTSNIQDAAPLTPRQKFRLALRSSIDPFQFVAAGLDAGISQWQDAFPGYGEGAQGYGKRFAAAYTDQFSGTMWGNAIFPALLHQDPRYFRKGTGTFKSRLWYAILTTVKAKNDAGKWEPNYSNVLGNIVAGGLANLYYPSTDRGVGLTFQRAFTVTAEGAIGAVFVEFWPDISRRVFHKHALENTLQPASSTPQSGLGNPPEGTTGNTH